jgi:hypothetical protein
VRQRRRQRFGVASLSHSGELSAGEVGNDAVLDDGDKVAHTRPRLRRHREVPQIAGGCLRR